MESISAAVIAVVGTLLGSLTTYMFQRRTAERAEQIARSERFRQERRAVFAEFAGAVTDFRRAAYEWWHRHNDDHTSLDFVAARDEYYRLYSIARHRYLTIRLLTDDAHLVDLADQAIERATDIKDAGTEDDRAAAGERANRALDVFVLAALAALR